ncbi:MAG: hypothetical protein PUJ80_10060 [Verrucomicrobiota bacterium]|nr:hypothetical protein [Verrucomicrobiota bacterium]
MIDLKSRIKWWIAVSLSAMAVLALFSRSVAFSYIGIDDAAYTFRNPFVASGFSLDNVVEAFANLRHGGIWMPITYISYMVDFSICKMSGIPLMQMLHLTNVLLHVVNFCLLIRFMRGLCVPSSVWPFSAMAGGSHDGEGAVATQGFGRAMHGGDTQMVQSPNGQRQSQIANRKIANRKFLLLIVFAALIWAIHPLRVEPVAWVAARKELLWTLFALLGLLSWMRFCSPGSRALGQPSDSTATTTRASSPRQGFGRAGARPSRVTHDGEGDVATQDIGRAGARPSRAVHGDDTQMTKSPNGQMQSEIANRKIANGKWLACLTVLFCILACLSKPTAMCFPLLALLVDWCVRRKPNAIGKRKSKITAYILMLLVAGATAAVAAYSQTHVAGQDVTSIYATPLPQRLVNALSAIGYYLRATIWPFGLHIDCRTVKSLMPLEGWLNLSVFAVACVACLWSAFRGWRNASNRKSGGHQSSAATTAGVTQFSVSESGFGHAGARPSRVTHDGEGAVATQDFGRAMHGGDTQMVQSPNGQMQSEIANRKIVNSPEQSEIVNHKSKIRDALIFSILWFATGLLPTLGIFGGFGIEAHADRFAYLPSMAIPFLCAALLAVGVGDFGGVAGRSEADGLSPSGIAVKWALPAAVLALAAVTFRQLGFWRDDATAYHRVLVCDPEHPRAMVHVADSLCSRRRDFAGGIAMYRKSLSLADTVPDGGINVADVRARLAYALASRGGYDDFGEVKRLGADVLKDVRLDRRGMMLDALGTAFMQEGDYRLAAMLFEASLKAPDRFWPKASTQRKLDVCKGGF